MTSDRLTTILLSVVGALLLAALLYGIFGPKKVNWDDSFAHKDKRPFGTYILYEELDQLFPDSEIEEITDPALNQLAFEDFSETTYLFINDDLPFDEYEQDELLRFVAAGNQVFVASDHLPDRLRDTLGIETIASPLAHLDSLSDSVDLHFLHPQFEGQVFRFDQKRFQVVIYPNDDLSRSSFEILAENKKGEVYAIKLAIGEGHIIYATTPYAFSNYHLIHPEQMAFATHLLSHLPTTSQFWWDEYYKVEQLLRAQRRNQDGDSPGLLAYLFSKEALAWAFWLLLASILLYGIFEFKRTQRIIPVIKPLPNTTLDFTETVGRLYFQSRDHKAVAVKKITIFLGFVRSQYNLKTSEFSEEFIQTLAGKSGVEVQDVRDLCSHITAVKTKSDLSEKELVELNDRIEHFIHK